VQEAKMPGQNSNKNQSHTLTEMIFNRGRFKRPKSDIELIEHTIQRECKAPINARLAADGALCVDTNRTGRSPSDRYIIEGKYSSQINWNSVNKEMPRAVFVSLMDRVMNHVDNLAEPLFFSDDLYIGKDSKYSQPIRLATKYAWHHLFGRNFFIKGDPHDGSRKPWTLLSVPSFITVPERDSTHSDGVIAIDLDEQVILIANRTYGGCEWKSFFAAMNILLPLDNVLTMHCGANITKMEGNITLFLGLSGTGKTALSADPDCLLIGDDGHAWGPDGIFNLAGGCYAKLHDITKEREQLIWNALRFGTIMENVVLDSNRVPDFEAGPENIRGLYPMEFIEDVYPGERAGHPDAIIFLTCDMYGVLPPVAKLSHEQAVYYFAAGYTTKIGSTEANSLHDFEPTFSAYFGEVFFPLLSTFYLELFQDKLRQHKVPVYLVNTGWTGGPMGSPAGRRFSIATSRNIVHAIQHNKIHDAELVLLTEHNLLVPKHISGVDERNLNPSNMWQDQAEYHSACRELDQLFHANMAQKFPDMASTILVSGRPQS
jgi:phosphoenolpyruvate carboxykinase (ATP)